MLRNFQLEKRFSAGYKSGSDSKMQIIVDPTLVMYRQAYVVDPDGSDPELFAC
jgi:hypothetical protein